MNSIPLHNPDRRIDAPKNWNHETQGLCHTLEVWDREGWMISAWQPTEAERKRIAEGAPVYLHIAGRVHPVVSMAVGEASDIKPLEIPNG